MDRRNFLLTGAAVLAASGAEAQMKMRDMPGMGNMDGMHSAMPHAGKGLALPEGAPFKELPVLANTGTTPNVFEAVLAAAPDKKRFASNVETPVLAYNGETPGPMIVATEGTKVRIAFVNNLRTEESTIHWHGMPVPADQDGNPTDPVAAKASRVYEFELPEDSAGSYWYHPHPHGRTAEQVYRGLAGAFIVKAKSDPIPAAYGDTSLLFTDLRIAADGTMPGNTMADLMNGRVGDHVLVNGVKNPTLTLPPGTARRFRLFNATNARYLRLAFGGLPITIIGSDGGLLEAPVHGAKEVLLAPAERMEIIVAFDKPGPVKLQTLSYDRGWMGEGRPKEAGMTLLTVDVAGEKAAPMPQLPDRFRTIATLESPVTKRRFVFGENMTMNGDDMKMDFLINGASFDMHRVDVQTKVGQVELWEIENPTDMDHPFHVHGTQFQIAESMRGGKARKPAYKAWKDTVNVARGETVRLLVRQDRPGLRMYHCHILEHEQQGMMGIVNVQA
ncbi:multicopper oxidase family protein [Methylovirgula sp. 4M-Z18]|uniref:multicopper oxidase family protein n=1 Tax=Methylovirgula sp. 4M-Z18 TaxID=2293567 RepID=UPI000E2EAC84|nr:multicopper oxidase family protein [Methylovirgula sp. 4M-Z18]RFB79623.1 multicopper oxidase family protein [Methylovirgula sp. 4M-Z18]